MSVETYLIQLRQKHGISISIQNGDLRIRVSKGTLTNKLTEEIRRKKSEILEYLEIAQSSRTSAIDVSDRKEFYPLLPSQERLYFLYEFNRSSLAYNMPQAIELKGDFDKYRLEDAFVQLITRHEILRTSFERIDGEVSQKIARKVSFKLSYREGKKADWTKIISNFIRPFDLSEAPMLRAELVSFSKDRHILIVDMHHIIVDGISQGLLIRDFIFIYNGEDLPELRLQYKDYAVWHFKESENGALKGHKDFWINEFRENIAVLELPEDYARPLVKNYSGNSIDFSLDPVATNKLRDLARREGATEFMIVLSLYNILLSKLSGKEDIAIGSPISNRDHVDLAEMTGLFINTLVLRNYPAGQISFLEFLREVKNRTLRCMQHQSYQYEELLDELRLPRDTSRNPLFDVMFSYVNYGSSELVIPGLEQKYIKGVNKVSKFDLTLIAGLSEEGMSFSMEYSTELFRESTISRFIKYFKQIISSVLQDPEIRLSEIEMLTSGEQEKLLYAFNNTEYEHGSKGTVIAEFERQVKAHPESVALKFKGEELSYGEFSSKVNRLCNVLREKGIREGDIVGIMMDRSFELLIGIFSIMKVGAAYLPMDSTHPSGRLDYMLEDSGAVLLLTQTQGLGKVSSKVSQLSMDSIDLSAEVESAEDLSRIDDLAYVIYTSGSTGNPKGVMIEHGSLKNRLNWMQRCYPIDRSDVVLQKTPIAFDVSVWELMWWSQVGSSLSLLGQKEEKDPSMISECIARDQVSVMHFVPSMMRIFLDYLGENMSDLDLSTLRQVFSSGEELKAKQVNMFDEVFDGHVARLTNLYGPTEATIDVSYYDCFSEETYEQIPIGKPIDNTELYVLDQYNKLQPIGVKGELCIGGSGLARGYLNNEGLTKEKFIPNPFKEGERLYRTGDLARWLPDGNLEFLGRKDDQVKVRGYRIELGEIEHQLLSHEKVQEAIVLAKDREEDKYLVGYYVSDEEVASEELHSYLYMRIPLYMIPGYYVHLDCFPLTSNGKVDKKSLPEPELKAGADYVAPTTETEEKLVELWSEVLGIDQEEISVTRSFFEQGGHSLKVALLTNKISREFGIEIPLQIIFTTPTIQGISKFIISISDEGNKDVENKYQNEYHF